MNERFVCVKVDREERPDVDGLYMEAVVAMTGHGGWPLTVALTPDGKPFWGGTYFPPEPRFNMPSFRQGGSGPGARRGGGGRLPRQFDGVHGGLGGAPKFPPASTLEFLLRMGHDGRAEDALPMATLTLDRMAAGGIYDQLGGGFHR